MKAQLEKGATRASSLPGAALLTVPVLLTVLTSTGPAAERQFEDGRLPCASYAPWRQPFFGDMHGHTSYSFDAAMGGVHTTPREAYAFARGGSLELPPYDPDGKALRVVQLQRRLDFAVVTDHAEYFGETQVCGTPDASGYGSAECTLLRNAIGTSPDVLHDGLRVFGLRLFYRDLPRMRFCGSDLSTCLVEAESIWLETQAAAEEAYDRTSACAFTSFIGYEWSGNTRGLNLHRNVIFRNGNVPNLPTSYFEASTPFQLFASLRNDCVQGIPTCDVLTIPHNSNLAKGRMFDSTGATASSNFARATMEPLVEIVQTKGESECRTGVGNNDENCGFEKLDRTTNTAAPNAAQIFPGLSFVRNALLEGLVQEGNTGVNPFRFGFVGGTDTHSAALGATEENNFPGHAGLSDATPEAQLGGPNALPIGLETNPGGLTVLWAEENTRESLWRGMKRRETYATSGTRPLVRFFGGFHLPSGICESARFGAIGYIYGVPMGGTIPRFERVAEAPRFAVLALQDVGAPGHPGTPLQRVQIIKGWTDAEGTRHEEVHEVAGDPHNGADVELSSCTPDPSPFSSLCALWSDPDFDPAEKAFYYARVLENPSCRWSTHLCLENRIVCDGLTPSQPGYDACCDPTVPKTIQERAWTSPIWYQPPP